MNLKSIMAGLTTVGERESIIPPHKAGICLDRSYFHSQDSSLHIVQAAHPFSLTSRIRSRGCIMIKH